ncbi:MAG: DUF2339 domain-containing protein [Pseudomonadota bacterium]|nr:DUF2339 domain-containing protein [Pseudomonadota bacterium]
MLPGFGGNVVFGALLGVAAGWSLQRAVRGLVRQEIAAARRQQGTELAPPVVAMRESAGVPTPAPMTTPIPVPAPMERALTDGVRTGFPVPPALAQPAAARMPVFEDDDPFFQDTVPAPEPRAQTGFTLKPPKSPPVAEQVLEGVRQWFLRGNPIVRAGLIILFIGLSFLARYAAQMGLFPVELRLAAIGAAGIALLGIGFRQRLARPAFGLVMQGAGVAVLYLTIFAAYRLYGLVPQGAAFAFMVLVCAASCALALMQNARGLAFAAFAGGFATPLLLSSGAGSHVALFGYYTLLNLAILFIASRRAWRELNLLGFVATFGTATAWGWMRYEPGLYATSQAFLAIFIGIFIATAILYARAAPLRLSAGGGMSRAVDTTLVFGTPLVGFGLQAGLVSDFWHGDAFSALAFGAVYLVLAAVLLRRANDGYRLLVECFLALGVGFATLAVPLALDARWTSAVWALEGAAAFWVGMRQARWMARAFGLGLQALAALTFIATLGEPVGRWPLAHPGFLGAMLIALPALATAAWTRQPLPHSESRWARGYAEFESLLPTPLFLYGFAFWLLAWAQEITRRLPVAVLDAPQSMVWSSPARHWLLAAMALASAAAALAWALRARWPVAAWPSRFSLPVRVLVLLAQRAIGHHVIDGISWLAWPLALAAHAWLLHRNEHAGAPLLTPAWRPWMAWQHPGGAWLVMALLADALYALIDRAGLWGTAWASVVGLGSATAVLVGLTLWAGRANQASTLARRAWPLNPHAPGYHWLAALPLALGVGLGALGLACTSSGHTAPLPYLPLLNPTDLTVLLALGALLLWRGSVLRADPRPAGAEWLRQPLFWSAWGTLALVALSTVWLRVAHHFFGVPWTSSALFNSFVVQTGYAILWTLIALALMVGAHRRGLRPAWLAGAGLLALVVLKLLLIDLANSGGGERIIAFIGVGVLMLVVGYFAPLPPKPARRAMGAEP